MTAGLAVANLHDKLADVQFRSDLDLLVAEMPSDYDVDSAADLVVRTLLSKIDW